jgi:hypothetical protein
MVGPGLKLIALITDLPEPHIETLFSTKRHCFVCDALQLDALGGSHDATASQEDSRLRILHAACMRRQHGNRLCGHSVTLEFRVYT